MGRDAPKNITIAPGTKIKLPNGNIIKADVPGAKIGEGKGNNGRGGGEGRLESRWKPLVNK
jgi:hypothetical protein